MMCGRSHARRKTGSGHRHHGWHGHRGHRHGHFFGLDEEKMAPREQVATALAVLAPVALSGLALVVFVPGLWWIFTTYFWVAFPALGLLARGLTGTGAGTGAATGEARPAKVSAADRERKLLEALRDRGELTSARAAVETGLSVSETDAVLKGLAEEGHLEVRVRGGGIFYALWERELEGGGVV